MDDDERKRKEKEAIKDELIDEVLDEINRAKEASFWKAQPTGGRQKQYSPQQLWEAACEYFEWIDKNPMKEEKIFSSKIGIVRGTVSKRRPYQKGGLAIFLGISVRTLHNYCNDNENYADFIPITEQIVEIIRTQKFEGAASGFFKENIIAQDLGLKTINKIEIENDYEITIGRKPTEKE